MREVREMGEKLTQQQRDKLADAEETIWETFDWSASRAGYNFWARVCRELQRIAKTGEP